MVERITRSFYRDSPNGLIGNDDCGQMSAWLVFATLGIYPINPGHGEYMTGLPLVKKALLHLQTGTLTVRADLPSSFVRSRVHQVALRLDGIFFDSQKSIAHQALLKARTLDFLVTGQS